LGRFWLGRKTIFLFPFIELVRGFTTESFKDVAACGSRHVAAHGSFAKNATPHVISIRFTYLYMSHSHKLLQSLADAQIMQCAGLPRFESEVLIRVAILHESARHSSH